MHGKLRQPGRCTDASRGYPGVARGFRLPPPGLLLCPVPVPGRVWHPALAREGDRRPRRDGDGSFPCPIPQCPGGPSRGSNQLPAATDIRQDLKAFDSRFELPAARIQVVTSLAGAASPWQASGEEVEDFEIVHAVAHAATLRVVLQPSDVLDSAANATADMLAALRRAVSGTDVASISWSLGEHYFTSAQVAQMHSILLGRPLTTSRWTPAPATAARPATLGGACPSRRSAFRPPTRSCWALAARAHRKSLDRRLHRRDRVDGRDRRRIGGGFSHRYAPPAYQDGVPGISTMRGVPDVAGAAGEPGGGLSLVLADGGKTFIVRPAAPAPPRRCGADSSRWPTSTPTTTLASLTLPSTASPAAPATTRHSTILLLVATL